MANNYLQFSTEVVDLTPEEQEWFKKLDNFEFVNDEEPEPLPEGLDLSEEEIDRLSWAFRIDRHGESLHIHAEEAGDATLLGKIMHVFLGKFRPNDRWSVTWAETCSSMRVGEFCGGIVVADKDGWASFSAYELEGLSSKAVLELREGISEARKDGG